MYKILIADDEEKIREVIKEYASLEGYEVFEASNGIEAADIVKNNDIDAVILDIMMPGMDGYSACREIKRIKNVPVIILSARSEEYDKLYGFQLGIDDYVTKPFSPREIMARLKVVITRNSGGSFTTPEKYVFDGLEIDISGRSVTVDGVKAEMTPREYDLLFYLVKNKNLALSRDKLLSDVWGYDYFGDNRTVDTHIKMLRTNLGKYRDFIVTLRSLGYKFEAR